MNLSNLTAMAHLMLAQVAEKAAPPPEAATPDAAQGASDAAQQAPGLLGSPIFMIVAFVAIFYFLMIAPQRKQQKERQNMLSALSKGDSVVTTGGICGTVAGLSDTHVVLKVDDNVTMEFVRGAVSQVTDKAGETKKK